MAELIPGVRNSARALILRDERLLLLRKQGDVYALPGGGQDTGESLETALQRECREEIDTEVLSPTLVRVCDYVKLKRTEPPLRRHQVDFLFLATVPDDYTPRSGTSPDKRQLEVCWVGIDALPRLAFSPFYLADLLPRLVGAGALPAEPLYAGEFHDPADT